MKNGRRKAAVTGASSAGMTEFIGEMMRLKSVPRLGWLLRGLGNHGLWLAFLAFMALRGLISALLAWRLAHREGWLSDDGSA